MSQCPRGATGPTEWQRTELCTASGGVEADDSVCVEQRNPYISFSVDGIGGSPLNGSFSMAITNFARNDICKSRPMSACQRVTRVFDSKLSARSSERDQRILAASRSASWTLLHRERKGGLN